MSSLRQPLKPTLHVVNALCIVHSAVLGEFAIAAVLLPCVLPPLEDVIGTRVVQKFLPVDEAVAMG